MNKLNELNETLEKLNIDYFVNQKSIQQPPKHFNENEMDVKELMQTQIDNTNKMNEKYNSFLTDKNICVNNPYYNINNQPSSINTIKSEVLTDNNDSNTRLKEFQFQHYNETNNYQKNNQNYNKISEIDELNRNKNKYITKKNITSLTNDNHTPLGRAISTSYNINYEINENFKNKNENKKTNKDISNERLEAFSPLSKTSQIPIKTKTPPELTNEMNEFLNSYKNLKKHNLNINYKKVATETCYNNRNHTNINKKDI